MIFVISSFFNEHKNYSQDIKTKNKTSPFSRFVVST